MRSPCGHQRHQLPDRHADLLQSGGSVTVGPVTSTDSAHLTKAADNSWYAYFDNAGAAEKHLYVFTAVGWTLTGGSAQVSDASRDAFLNLSHTCKGTGASSSLSESPSPSTSASAGTSQSPTPGASQSTPSTSVSPSPSSSGGLPVIGVAWGAMVLTAVALIAAGVGLLAVRRRRELTEQDAA